MGAWIEIIADDSALPDGPSRTLHGCVDWNPWSSFQVFMWSSSHPTWVRGLKSLDVKTLYCLKRSHPTWVRGLKFLDMDANDKLEVVAPYMGAWIEI